MPQSPGAILDALLKRPQQFVAQIDTVSLRRTLLILTALALTGFALYGLVVGTFSGGTQLWAAPLKVSAGSLLTALICMPSLDVFSCLSAANVRLAPICATLLASMTLQALLLISFAPVAWVFSQSTDSAALIGTLHLIFWFIGLVFGLRLISASAQHFGARDRGYLHVWFMVFTLVSLQMMTLLRPIIGKAPTFLPHEKRFFLEHWGDCLH